VAKIKPAESLRCRFTGEHLELPNAREWSVGNAIGYARVSTIDQNLHPRPAEFRRAHGGIDRYVDGLYRAAPFTGWEDRTRHRLELHRAAAAEGGRRNS
jgi:hypothetical protein